MKSINGKQRTPITVLLAILLLGTACTKETSDEGSEYKLKVRFRIVANGDQVRPNVDYINAFGEDYTVSDFRMYISQIGLLRQGNVQVQGGIDETLLIDIRDSSTLVWEREMRSLSFDRLVFQVGVDSALNVSGAQSGALDPSLGMFWTWNSGYIMARFEGRSSQSNELNQAFVYHIGGFQGQEAAQRRIELTLPGDQLRNLEKGRTTELLVSINLDKWFNGRHPLRISDNAATMTPGPLAMRYADNYATLFTVEAITIVP